jgi:hypothetical protein
MKTCETCNAFFKGEHQNKDGSWAGECRARPPVIVSSYHNDDGGFAWNGGWIPVRSNGWCREHEEKKQQ